jgi:hypothetical protein
MGQVAILLFKSGWVNKVNLNISKWS